MKHKHIWQLVEKEFVYPPSAMQMEMRKAGYTQEQISEMWRTAYTGYKYKFVCECGKAKWVVEK